jgi:selenide,water dikinase
MNPWPIIGGVANVVCQEDEYIRPYHGKAGDIIVLTKPLGTQVAVNLHEWRILKNEKWIKSSAYLSESEALETYYLSMESMAHLNMNTARLMMKYKSNGATDITGFGLLGHA